VVPKNGTLFIFVITLLNLHQFQSCLAGALPLICATKGYYNNRLMQYTLQGNSSKHQVAVSDQKLLGRSFAFLHRRWDVDTIVLQAGWSRHTKDLVCEEYEIHNRSGEKMQKFLRSNQA